jgi:chloramphenicol-sensitive protein RarD
VELEKAELAGLIIRGDDSFLQASPTTALLLIGTGAVTAVPLIFFGAGARLIPLSTIGLLQYIAPTIQFLLGVLLYREPFTTDRLIGFSLIWLALAIFALDNVRRQGQNHLRGRRQNKDARLNAPRL